MSYTPEKTKIKIGSRTFLVDLKRREVKVLRSRAALGEAGQVHQVFWHTIRGPMAVQVLRHVKLAQRMDGFKPTPAPFRRRSAFDNDRRAPEHQAAKTVTVGGKEFRVMPSAAVYRIMEDGRSSTVPRRDPNRARALELAGVEDRPRDHKLSATFRTYAEYCVIGKKRGSTRTESVNT